MAHQSDLIASDILAYLAQHEKKELLRFLTCGNVDDGKSTLIGRLLHDSKMIYEDQIAALKKDSSRFGTTGDDFDPALLMDGLEAEREQGITIDVAYRYFSTTRRKFIIADTPGHEQYTRNMATGASTCDLAIILIDARYGVQTQTRRHSYIVSLLGIRHVIVAINKMDLVGFDEAVFENIRADYLAFAQKLHIPDIRFIPISALKGDNVVNPSTKSPWYSGKPLLELLDTIEIHDVQNYDRPRFPVQYVNRPNLDFRGYSGTVASGVFRVGDAITVLPSGASSQLAAIVTYDGQLEETFAGQAVTLTLEDEIDISRGDVLVRSDDVPQLSHHLEAHIVWMTEKPLTPGQRYLIKHNTRTTPGVIDSIHYRIDVNTQTHHPAEQLQLNEIGLCDVTVNIPLAFDPYSELRGTGAFIIIDRLTNITIGAGLLTGKSERQRNEGQVSEEEWALRLGQRAAIIQVAGPKRSVLATKLERQLFNLGHIGTVLTEEESLNADVLAVLKRIGVIAILLSKEPRAKTGDLVITEENYSLESVLDALSLSPQEISAQNSAFDPKI